MRHMTRAPACFRFVAVDRKSVVAAPSRMSDVIDEAAQRAASRMVNNVSSGMASAVNARGDQRSKNMGSTSWAAVRPFKIIVLSTSISKAIL